MFSVTHPLSIGVIFSAPLYPETHQWSSLGDASGATDAIPKVEQEWLYRSALPLPADNEQMKCMRTALALCNVVLLFRSPDLAVVLLIYVCSFLLFTVFQRSWLWHQPMYWTNCSWNLIFVTQENVCAYASLTIVYVVTCEWRCNGHLCVLYGFLSTQVHRRSVVLPLSCMPGMVVCNMKERSLSRTLTHSF